MTELLTSAQMRAIEQVAIASGKVTGLELMERAGQGVVEAIYEEWPEFEAPTGDPIPSNSGENGEKVSLRAVVLCGPGNNGGDGFVVARLLAARGWDVEVFLYGDAEKLPPDARVNYERWLEVGPVNEFTDGSVVDRFNRKSVDLVVDAIFGTGLKRPMAMSGRFLFVEQPSGKQMKVVSVDLPSGLCSDSGRELGDTVFGDLTVTFHSKKLGHVLVDGPAQCGQVVVVDIGLKPGIEGFQLYRQALQKLSGVQKLGQVVVYEAMSADPYIGKFSYEHKFTHGHAFVLSGGFGATGAARLAARGALRMGAGLVTVGAPAEAMAECASQLTAIMVRQVDDGAVLNDVLQDERINALCVGPGLGLDRVGTVRAVLASGRAAVLDADALTLLSRDADLFAMLHDKCVLTPHGGEFARLFPDLAAKLDEPAVTGPAYSKVDATRAAAARAGCVVLFKGPDTVIAAPNGTCSINSAHYDREAPWLATAGSGDVLAGFITGLLARGFEPMAAAETAAWLHVECARAFGPGLIAEDLPEMLPNVLQALIEKG